MNNLVLCCGGTSNWFQLYSNKPAGFRIPTRFTLTKSEFGRRAADYCNTDLKSSKTYKSSSFKLSASKTDVQWGFENSPEVIIVGAGVAGAAFAHTLAKDGRRVHVIERDLRESDRMVGECLQPAGYLKLIELGLEDCLKDIDAQEVFGIAFYKEGKHAIISYPTFDKFEAAIQGRSFHNGRFIQRMRQKAAALPNVRLEQGTVTSLVKENGVVKGVKYKTESGQELASYAPLTVVCDGCLSNLRRSLSENKVNVPSFTVGLILENCQLPDKNHLHIVLADSSPIVLYQISNTEIRCFIDLPGQKPPSISNGEMSNYLKSVVASEIPPQVHAAFLIAVEKGEIRTMPNRSMPADPHFNPGALLLGDALNMRHPWISGGMTVALSDVVVLRNLLRCLHKFPDPQTLSKYLESFHKHRNPTASVMNMVADRGYSFLSGLTPRVRKKIEQACVEYASLGGFLAHMFVAMVAGMNPRFVNYLPHFFDFVVFMAGRFLLPYPTPQRMRLAAKVCWDASRMILPIFGEQGRKQTFI